MKAKQRKNALWISIAGLLVIGAAVTSLLVLASGNDITFRAEAYSDVIRFEVDGVGSLQIRIYDMAQNELWDSGQIWMDFVDWDRTNEWGERLANGYYIYFAQAWSITDEVVLSRTGKVVLLPGDQVQLQSAPVVSSPPTQDEEWREEPVFSPRQVINDNLTVNGTITSQLSWVASNFLRVHAGGTGNRAAFTLYGYNASNFGDYATFTMRTDLADLVLSVYDNSSATWNPAYSFRYLQSVFDFKGNTVENIGKLGVGTTSPLRELHVISSISGGGVLVESSSAPAVYLSNTGHSKQWAMLVEDVTGNFIIADISTANNQRFFIDGAGNVGVGVPSPTSRLTVAGIIESTTGGFRFPDGTTQTTAVAAGGSLWTTSGDDISNGNSGNVGIRDTTPSQKLEVAGSIALSGYVYQGSSLLLHNHGSDNVFLGINSGNPTMIGTDNTGVGVGALASNSTGIENTALGNESLANLTTGDSNTALGEGAGFNLTNGSRNIYIGSPGVASESNLIRIGDPIHHVQTYLQGPVTIENYTLPDTDGTAGQVLSTNGGGTVSWQTISGGGGFWTATGNDIHNTNSGVVNLLSNLYKDGSRFMHDQGTGGTFLGTDAGNLTLTGPHNTGLGYNTLASDTSGEGDTAVGWRALEANTIGHYNTAVGGAALQTNTEGYSNTAVGHQALIANVSGDSNTAVGASSLGSNFTGTHNIAIGAGAGSNLSVGQYNIYIGNYGVTNESSTIRLGAAGQTRAFISGIHGATVSGGAPVYVLSDGQLGTITSSARFKTEIADLGSESEVLYDMRPVRFKYRPEIDPSGLAQYGLIAEEVAEVAPDLVIIDENGDPYTVRYEQLVPLLLNELQEQGAKIDELQEEKDAKIDQLLARLGALEQEVEALK